MMTTYELIRRLAQIDPSGDKPVMVSLTTMLGSGRTSTSDGFLEDLWVEKPEGCYDTFIVLSALNEGD